MAFTCSFCSFTGRRGLCEKEGSHHAPYCPRFLGSCKFCGCVGNFDCITQEHGLHRSSCPRFIGQCKLCGVTGPRDQVAVPSAYHKPFCERFSERCHYCGAEEGHVPGGHHQVTCPRFRGRCQFCDLVGPGWYVVTAGPQHHEDCPRRWQTFEPLLQPKVADGPSRPLPRRRQPKRAVPALQRSRSDSLLDSW
ncbi:hypothetical protein AK812_SmicGene5328 [Symbiodinium microadriaticum]|uniref:Uncharacterized protein n=1 Tax=Symbiodinium microadriaticum TaxID=2951 RepID=A0A1Q9EU27_SYMMI|nr:hypothetical protein AK812_SmicGene5328 [Symbiodinium microadriaticum]